uniref:Tan_10cys n=1 Tax=Terebra anilis TaxID=553697 RepID=TAC_TERAN|nr:RecName: Full=Tan_10cys; Flags: Precursor [Terebra anilis]
MNLKVLFLLAMVLVTLCLGEDRVTDRRQLCKCCAKLCHEDRDRTIPCSGGNSQFCEFCKRTKQKIRKDCNTQNEAKALCVGYFTGEC